MSLRTSALLRPFLYTSSISINFCMVVDGNTLHHFMKFNQNRSSVKKVIEGWNFTFLGLEKSETFSNFSFIFKMTDLHPADLLLWWCKHNILLFDLQIGNYTMPMQVVATDLCHFWICILEGVCIVTEKIRIVKQGHFS